MKQEQDETSKGQKVTFGHEMAICPSCGGIDINTSVPAYYNQLVTTMSEAEVLDEEYVPLTHFCNGCDTSFDEDSAKYFMWSDREEFYALHRWWWLTRSLRDNDDYSNKSDERLAGDLSSVASNFKGMGTTIDDKIAPLVQYASKLLNTKEKLDTFTDRMLDLRMGMETKSQEDLPNHLIQAGMNEVEAEFNLDQAKTRSRVEDTLNLFKVKKADD